MRNIITSNRDKIKTLSIDYVSDNVNFAKEYSSGAVSNIQDEEDDEKQFKPPAVNDTFQMLDVNDDAFLSGCVREYFSDTRHEIISSSSRSMFYVFKQVTDPAPINNCDKIGNGILADSFNSYTAAKKSIELQSLDRFDMPKM